MRRFIAGITTAASLLLSSTSWAQGVEADKLLLSLQHKQDDIVLRSVELFANDIDPNSSASEDVYRLEINGQAVPMPPHFMAELDYNRRGYSYDSFTGGVRDFVSGGRCMMAGPAEGYVLRVRYLTYEDNQIVADEMRPIISENANCLFSEGHLPMKTAAQLEAAKAMTALRTMLEVHGSH